MDELREKIRRIMISTNKIDGAYYLFSRHIGFKANTLSLLYALDDGKAHSQKSICAEWLIPRTTLNTVVRECVENGYIILRSAEHTREKLIQRTAKGKEYTDQMLSSIYQAEQSALVSTLKDFSDEFICALETFASHLSSEFEREFAKQQS